MTESDHDILLRQQERILELETEVEKAKKLIGKYLDILTTPSKRIQVDEVISETVAVLGIGMTDEEINEEIKKQAQGGDANAART